MRESIPASQLLIETTFYKENLRGTRTDVELFGKHQEHRAPINSNWF